MFQFRRFPTYAYFVQRRLTEYCSAGFPHSVILGSTPMCGSPRLIAACHDLLRLLMPRHSPCALSSLTFRITFLVLRLCPRIMQAPEFFGFLLCYPFISSTIILPSLLLALYIWNFFLHCSVFKVQSPVSLETRYELSILHRVLVSVFNLVGPSGLEPPTSRLSVVRSSQLSYGPVLVEIIGLEPMTPCLQSRCSPS